jgi:cellulose synthase/poly-beta-1,6-N-acetylglucosamine synthase-like glycosyltransferase
VLFRQRNRWHRGLIETLLRHRRMIGRRRYGVIGVFAMPYFLVFEALGPLLETLGYLVVVVALIFGLLAPWIALSMLALSLTYGLVLSFGALLIEEHAFRRYRSWRCIARLAVAAIVENFGYRQISSLVRAWAFVTLLRRRGDRWGDMTRTGFTAAASPAVGAGPYERESTTVSISP